MPADSGIQGILLTAIVGALAAYANQLWKYNKDAYHARVDEACKLIFELADRSAEYWATAKKRPTRVASSATEGKSQLEKLIISEIQIEGQLMELQFLRLSIQSRFGRADGLTLVERTASFQDAITGGDFSAHARAADTQRGKQIYVEAADLVGHIRQAASRGNRLWRMVLRQIESLLPRWPTTFLNQIAYVIWMATASGFFLAGCVLIASYFF